MQEGQAEEARVGADPALMQEFMRQISKNMISLNKASTVLTEVIEDLAFELETFRVAMGYLKERNEGGKVTLHALAQAYWEAMADAEEAEEEGPEDGDNTADIGPQSTRD